MPYETKTLQQMTTIEEIKLEIEALNNVKSIIEDRTGDKLDNTELLKAVENHIYKLKEMAADELSELPVHPYEPEFEKD